MLNRSRVRPRIALLALVPFALAPVAAAGPAAAALPQQSGAVPALSPVNLQIAGSPSDSRFGSSVAIGDVNGDGIDDMVVGALEQNAAPGGAYVIYGGGDGEPAHVSLAADGEIPASEGFRIVAPAGSGLLAGRAVADAGDVNGDGYDDVVVGANGIAHNYGGAFVVYGGPHDGTVELTEAGLPESVGFMLKAPGEVDNAGISVAGGEDVNGDGLDDIVIGDGGYDPTGPVPPYNTGAAFVVYGKAGERPTVALGSLADNDEGFAIVGPDNNGYMEAVGMAGDVNGDGIDDVIVGDGGPYYGSPFQGFAAVVYGSADRSGNVAISRAGLAPAAGFMIESSVSGDGTGGAVSGTGDVNGDGYDDVVIGAPRSSPAGSAGNAYVVYGGESHETVALEPSGLPSATGFVVHGPAQGSLEADTGLSVAGGADVNGDGIDDTVVAAPYAGYLTGEGSVSGIGEAAIIYGVPGGRGSLTLPAPDEAMDPSEGFTIQGPGSGGYFAGPASSQTVALGDVNDDGRADVIAGSYYINGGFLVGALGFGTPTLAYPAAVSLAVNQPLDLGPVTLGHTGAPEFTVSPSLPPGLSLDPATGRITGAPAAPSPSTAYTVTMRDLVGSAAAEFTLAVESGESEPRGDGGADGAGPGGGPSSGPGASGVAGAAAPGGLPPLRIRSLRLSIAHVGFTPRVPTVDAAGKARRIHLVLRLSRPASISVRIKGGGTVINLALGRCPGGKSILDLRRKLADRTLVPGRYRAVLSAIAAGESAHRTVGFRVKQQPPSTRGAVPEISRPRSGSQRCSTRPRSSMPTRAG